MSAKPTKSDVLREYIKTQPGITPLHLSRALDLPYAHVWGLCRPMVMRGILTCDERGGYTFVREAMPPSSRKKDPSIRREYERERQRRRAAQRKADRACRLPMDRTLARQGEHSRRREVRAESVSAAARKACLPGSGFGASTESALVEFETVEQWMARTGCQPEVLRAGDVSPASRFQRIQVSA